MSQTAFKMRRSNSASHQHAEEADGEGSWAISYGDMITLLLAFFILFFSLEKPAPKGVNKMKAQLMSDLNAQEVSGGSAGAGKAQGADAKGADAKGADANVATAKPAAGKEDADKAGSQQAASASAGAAASAGSTSVEQTKVTYPKDFEGVAYDVKEKLLVEFPDISFFDSAQVELNDAGRKNIAEFGKKFAPYARDFNLVIQAYADPRKVRPDVHRFKDNLELTALRSIATMRELKKAGVPLSRMRTAGFGELILTARDLDSVDPKLRKPTSLNDLARRIVLVVEPVGGAQ